MNFLRSKKGFTLVEIIVVLVIIAILAAISLPALTGYIEDAKDKSSISDARTAYVAGQTISSELMGMNVDVDNIETYLTTKGKGTTGKKVPDSYTKTITTLSGTKSAETFSAIEIGTQGTVTKFVYGKVNAWVLYNGTEMTVDKSATAPSLPD